ncbi:MAG: tetratricopeptide repeat protein [Labilithrix sp.]|nr:tetratricopeptide repeat protein [Labilithrix sp.]
MKRESLLGAVALSLLLACGGPPKPPETPAETPPDTGATPSATPKPGPTEGPVAASTSDDVTKGTAAIKAGDWNAARASFEAALTKNPKQADAHYYLGLVMDKTGDRAAAEKHYREALAIQPDFPEPAENLVALLVEGQKYEEAITIAKKVLAKNAKNAEMQLNLAFALSGKGDVEGASKAFDDAVKLAPNDARFYLGYAQHLAAAKKTDEAIAKLKQAQRVAGDDPGMLASVALEQKNLRDFQSCVATLDHAIKLKDAAELRVYRGHCKLGLKDLPGALAEFQAAVGKEPNSAPAYYSLGGALADSGKLKEAIGSWEAYLKLAPNGPLAKQAEAKIKKAKELLAKGGKK